MAIAASSGALPPDGTLRAEPAPDAVSPRDTDLVPGSVPATARTMIIGGGTPGCGVAYPGGTGTAVTLGVSDSWVGAPVTAEPLFDPANVGVRS